MVKYEEKREKRQTTFLHFFTFTFRTYVCHYRCSVKGTISSECKSNDRQMYLCDLNATRDTAYGTAIVSSPHPLNASMPLRDEWHRSESIEL